MQKIKNIECLRTFLIFAIIILHMFIDRKWCLCTLFPDIQLYQNIKSAIAHSNNGVEGFFIIAGFLLFLTFKPQTAIKNFIKKKYIRLSPVIIFSILLCALGHFLGAMDFSFVSNLLTIFLLNSFTIKIAVGNNPVLWFTSTLFAGLLVYFCVIKYLPKFYTKITIPLIIFSYTAIELLQHGSFANPLKNYCVLNIGFLRALGGIGLGTMIGYLYKNNIDRINNFAPKLWQKILFTISELGLFSYMIWWMIFIHKSKNNLIIVLTFVFLLILLIIRKGYFSKFLDKDIWVFLGKYQYSLYVIHYVIIRIFGLSLWKNQSEFVHIHPILPVIIMLFVILASGVLTYHFIESPSAKYLKNKFLS